LMVVPLERSFCQYAIESGEFMTSCVSKEGLNKSTDSAGGRW
jgi:hypothetical protein